MTGSEKMNTDKERLHRRPVDVDLRTQTSPEAMNDVRKQEQSVLRWGGLAGILGGILFIVVFVIVGVFVGANPAEPEGFPDIRAARTAENSLYLAALVLWIIHYLALYRALRERSLAPALFGSALGILGLGVLAAGALPHVATALFSDLYHASGASPEDQATLVLSWQATQAIFDSLLVVGLVVIPPGLIALGIAMVGSPAFGKGFGRASAALGLVACVAACVLLVDPASPIAVVSIFALIVFHLVVGWKVYSLSRNPVGVIEDWGMGMRAEDESNSTDPINADQQDGKTP